MHHVSRFFVEKAMGKHRNQQVRLIEEIPFVNMEEVSFEAFDQTMKKIVKAKPSQTKPPKVE